MERRDLFRAFPRSPWRTPPRGSVPVLRWVAQRDLNEDLKAPSESFCAADCQLRSAANQPSPLLIVQPSAGEGAHQDTSLFFEVFPGRLRLR